LRNTFFIIASLFALAAVAFFLPQQQTPTGFEIALSDNSMVERSFVYTSVGPGEVFNVYIDVYIADDYEHYSYEITENVPTGWTVIDNGGAAQDGQQLTWSHDSPVPAEPVGFEYTVLAPSIGPGIFEGTFVIDGSVPDYIYGDSTIGVGICTNGQTRACTTINNCNGIQECTEAYWMSCVGTESYCDTDCDGTQECTTGSCAQCECTGTQTQECLTPNGCQGQQYCNSGLFGQCISSENYCDLDCDGAQECTDQACPQCSCNATQVVNCVTVNGCSGQRNCIDGVFGPCVSIQDYCDLDCDGTQECTLEDCPVCSCTGAESHSCTTANGCNGVQVCDHGEYLPCSSVQNYCDANCDGTPECTDQECTECGCIESWVCSSYSYCLSGIQTRTCTDQNSCGTTSHIPAMSKSCASGGAGGGGGGGSSAMPSGFGSCIESWACSEYGPCTSDGLKYRTCTDQNSCGTTNSQPLDLDTCAYRGSCSDKIMNGDEQGIDCGGSCEAGCSQVPGQLSLEIEMQPLSLELFEESIVSATIKNTGSADADGLTIQLNKWSPASVEQYNIGAGRELNVNIPVQSNGDYSTQPVLQVFQGNALVASKTVPIEIKVPGFVVKAVDKGGQYYAFIILDNREMDARQVNVNYKIFKGTQTVVDISRSINIAESQVYEEPDLKLQLGSGSYRLEAQLSEDNTVIAQYSENFQVSGFAWYYLLVLPAAIILGFIIWKLKK